MDSWNLVSASFQEGCQGTQVPKNFKYGNNRYWKRRNPVWNRGSGVHTMGFKGHIKAEVFKLCLIFNPKILSW